MEFISMGENKTMGNIPLKFLPSQIAGLRLWTRFNSGITVVGSGVNQWDDQSGNNNHLLQGTDANRPSKEADGSVLFDGTAHFLKANAFTLVQPETIYILCKQVSWTGGDRFFDGNTGGVGLAVQNNLTPDIKINAGLAVGPVSEMTINNYAVLSVVFNGASSVLKVNNDVAATGDAGASNMAGFTLASNGGGDTAYSNIQVKEVLIYNTAHDAATRAQIIKYLADVGDLSI